MTQTTDWIMIVDDDRAILDVISEVLLFEGYRVVAFTEGRAAVEQARTKRPNLILLDLMMPEMSGWEVLEALRAQPETAPIPVVLVSARRDVAEAAQSLKAQAFLDKPFEIDDLLGLVRNYVVAN